VCTDGIAWRGLRCRDLEMRRGGVTRREARQGEKVGVERERGRAPDVRMQVMHASQDSDEGEWQEREEKEIENRIPRFDQPSFQPNRCLLLLVPSTALLYITSNQHRQRSDPRSSSFPSPTSSLSRKLAQPRLGPIRLVQYSQNGRLVLAIRFRRRSARTGTDRSTANLLESSRSEARGWRSNGRRGGGWSRGTNSTGDASGDARAVQGGDSP
jgi:hypothetical protein